MISKDFLKEGFVEDATSVHSDHEVQMARKECYHLAENAMALHKLLGHMSEQDGLEGWVSAKITLANDYLNTVREHLEYQLMNPDAASGLGGGIGKISTVGLPIAELKTEEQQDVAEGSDKLADVDMTGKLCKKCKKDKYKERSQHDDMQGKVTCSCGHRIDRWSKTKKQGVAEGITDDDMAKTAYMYGRKHGNEGTGNDMNRAKAEWGDHFEHYNAGFLKGRNEKAKSLKAFGQGYGKKQQGVAEGLARGHYTGPLGPQTPVEKAQNRGWVHAMTIKDARKPIFKNPFDSSQPELRDAFLKGYIGARRKQQRLKFSSVAPLPTTGVAEEAKVTKKSVKETSAGSIAGVVNPGGKPKSQVGSLFGGTYKQSESKEDLGEVSAATKASYKTKATQQVKDLEPHAKKGEYKDIAQNIIKRRERGLARVDGKK